MFSEKNVVWAIAHQMIREEKELLPARRNWDKRSSGRCRAEQGDAPANPQALESYWLGGSAFVAGEAVSIGDLPIASELEQLRMLAGAAQVPRGFLDSLCSPQSACPVSWWRHWQVASLWWYTACQSSHTRQ